MLGAIDDLVQGARPRRPIGIFGHSNGGAAAAVATRRHPEIRAGVNLDGFIPELITAGLDRPFGLMSGLDQPPEELRDIETFLSNMRAPYRVRSLDIRHFGFSDFVVFNGQAQRADPALGSGLEGMFLTGTLDSLRAGRRALAHNGGSWCASSTGTWKPNMAAAPARIALLQGGSTRRSVVCAVRCRIRAHRGFERTEEAEGGAHLER